MQSFLLEEYGNPSQPYSFSRNSKKALQEARKTIANCIGAYPDEIFFTSGGTESDNWVIKSISIFNNKQGTILTSAIEHHAILRPCMAIEELGHPVAYMQPTELGEITPSILSKYISDATKLVSVMYVNNEIGTIQPIKELCNISHAHGALFHTDAVQAVGHLQFDVHDLEIDFLSASAHKFNGPKGIGFLYIRRGVSLSPLMHGGKQENSMRAGTENIAQIVGMAAALKENSDKILENKHYITQIEDTFLRAMNSSGITFVRNGIKQTPGLISLSFPNQDGEAILHRLDLHNICISTGSACDSTRTEISHVLKAVRLEETFAQGTIRISFGLNNTKEDARIIASELIQIIK